MSMPANIKWSVPDIGQEEIDAVTDALRDGWISGFGPRVKKFEREVERYLNVKHAIAVCNGTSGLIASYLAMRKTLNKKISIVIPTWTFFATATSADLVGETKLVDSVFSSFNMDYVNIPNVDIISPVDAGGFPADYYWLKQYDKPIIADSCESFGASYNSQMIGSIADITVFSFFSSKILATGEGGMITTNNDEYAHVIRCICDQGFKDVKTYKHSMKGYNFRMPELSAAIGLVQLSKVEKYLTHRHKLAKIYREELDGLVRYQTITKHAKPTYYLFTIIVEPKIRNNLIEGLTKMDIPTRTWTPIHHQPPFEMNEKFPVADMLYKCHVHLPIYNTMEETKVLYITETVLKLLRDLCGA